MSDRLAKAFDQHLSLALRDNPALRRQLLNRGVWKDFIAIDRPETADPVELAVAAMLYIGPQTREVVLAVFSFLRQFVGEPRGDVKQLAVLIHDLDRDGIYEWFDTAYAYRRTGQ